MQVLGGVILANCAMIMGETIYVICMGNYFGFLHILINGFLFLLGFLYIR